MIIAIEFAGAIAILLPFALLQARVTTAHSWLYLVLNLLGSAALTGTAVVHRQYGFVILQAVWMVVTAVGMAGRRRRGRQEAERPL